MTTTTTELENRQYPIGKYHAPAHIAQSDIAQWIEDVAALPKQIREAVNNLSPQHLDTPYRPNGWTVRQLVHHLADSHMNAFIRFKLALTEDNPIIRPYEEAEWAKGYDYQLSIEPSLQILEALHSRWINVLNHMKQEDFMRTYFHPESKKTMTLKYVLGMYSWHSRHHLAQITGLKERLGW